MKYKIETFRGYKKTHVLAIAELAGIAMLEELERENQPLENLWVRISEKQDDGTYKPLKYRDTSSDWILY